MVVAEDGGLVDEGFGSSVFPAEGVGADDAEAVVVAGLDGSAVGEGLVEDVPGGRDGDGGDGHRFGLLVGAGADAEEAQHGALSGVELGVEDLDGPAVLVEVVAGEAGEDVEDAGGAGGGAVAVFGVEADGGAASGGHGGADLAFDEGVDEQGQEVAAQQGFDAGGAVQADRGDGLGAFEAVVASFEVRLVAVGGEDLGGVSSASLVISGQQPSEAAARRTAWARSFQVSRGRICGFWRNVVSRSGTCRGGWRCSACRVLRLTADRRRTRRCRCRPGRPGRRLRLPIRVLIRLLGPARRPASSARSRSARSMRAARAVASRAAFGGRADPDDPIAFGRAREATRRPTARRADWPRRRAGTGEGLGPRRGTVAGQTSPGTSGPPGGCGAAR